MRRNVQLSTVSFQLSYWVLLRSLCVECGIGSFLSLFTHSLSRVQLFVTSSAAAWQASLSFTISWHLLKLMSIESVMPSNHLILCCPFSPTLIFPSISIFFNESALRIRWPKYWSFSFVISPSNEYSGLISFRIDWFDLLAVQGTLKSLLQHHSSPPPPPPTIPTLGHHRALSRARSVTAGSHWLSILYKVVYTCHCYSISRKAHS